MAAISRYFNRYAKVTATTCCDRSGSGSWSPGRQRQYSPGGGGTMTRILTVGAAQMGPIQRSHTRRDVVERLVAHLREAKRMGCELVVFPELTLTTFFPRWWMTDQTEIDSFFEREMPSNETAPLFTEAKRLSMGFSFGYAELANEGGRVRHFNTSIIVEKDGRIAGKYRNVP